MGYSIELSLEPCKHGNSNSLKELIMEKGKDYNCDNIYHFQEVERSKKKHKCHHIICASFSYEEIESLARFIGVIKKLSNVNIESVYEDDSQFRVLYASTYYLKQMEKEHVQIYKSNKRQRAYSEEEYILLKSLNKNHN